MHYFLRFFSVTQSCRPVLWSHRDTYVSRRSALKNPLTSETADVPQFLLVQNQFLLCGVPVRGVSAPVPPPPGAATARARVRACLSESCHGVVTCYGDGSHLRPIADFYSWVEHQPDSTRHDEALLPLATLHELPPAARVGEVILSERSVRRSARYVGDAVVTND